MLEKLDEALRPSRGPHRRIGVSFEFFPPQTLDASFRLWETVQQLAPLTPAFVSVTYGAGGTTRKLTHDAVITIGRNYGLNVAAHLTCVDATRAETLAVASAYADAGVTEIEISTLAGNDTITLNGVKSKGLVDAGGAQSGIIHLDAGE